MKTTKSKTAAARSTRRNKKRARPEKGQVAASRRMQGNGPKVDGVSADSKLATIIKLLSRREGATLSQMTNATGWQSHSVRGAMSGALSKKRGLTATSTKTDGIRVYRISGRVEG